MRSYVTEVRRILPPCQKELAKLTNGTHHGNHMSLVDNQVRNPDNPSEILWEGQLTHGKGSIQNPSVPLHPSKDIQGSPVPQNYVPPDKTTYVPEKFFHSTPVAGSKSFLEESMVKQNLAKNKPHDENT